MWLKGKVCEYPQYAKKHFKLYFHTNWVTPHFVLPTFPKGYKAQKSKIKEKLKTTKVKFLKQTRWEEKGSKIPEIHHSPCWTAQCAASGSLSPRTKQRTEANWWKLPQPIKPPSDFLRAKPKEETRQTTSLSGPRFLKVCLVSLKRQAFSLHVVSVINVLYFFFKHTLKVISEATFRN